MTAAWWVLAIALIVVGLIGTVLPALPGIVLVFAGIVLAAWIGHFEQVGALTLGVIGMLGLFGLLIDYLAAMAGARRAGASREAVIGALIGTLLGVASGLWGLIFMPLAGAAIGEYLAHANLPRAGSVGVATWIGMLIGSVAKLAIGFAMIGIFLFALFV